MRAKNTIKNIIQIYIWYLSGISNIPIRQNERKSIETLGKDPSGSKKYKLMYIYEHEKLEYMQH